MKKWENYKGEAEETELASRVRSKHICELVEERSSVVQLQGDLDSRTAINILEKRLIDEKGITYFNV